MKRGFFAYRRYRDRKAVARTVGFFLIVTLLAVLIYASLQMRPLVERMAVTRVENTVNRIVSEAVDEAITSGKLSYDRLISFEKDALIILYSLLKYNIFRINSSFMGFLRKNNERKR